MSRQTTVQIDQVLAWHPCWSSRRVVDYFAGQDSLRVLDVVADPQLTVSDRTWLLGCVLAHHDRDAVTTYVADLLAALPGHCRATSAYADVQTLVQSYRDHSEARCGAAISCAVYQAAVLRAWDDLPVDTDLSVEHFARVNLTTAGELQDRIHHHAQAAVDRLVALVEALP